MADLVTIREGNSELLTLTAEDVATAGGNTVFFIQLDDILDETGVPGRRRRRRRTGPGPIHRFLDPQRQHPILKNLWQSLGPQIANLIDAELPALIADLVDDEPKP